MATKLNKLKNKLMKTTTKDNKPKPTHEFGNKPQQKLVSPEFIPQQAGGG